MQALNDIDERYIEEAPALERRREKGAPSRVGPGRRPGPSAWGWGGRRPCCSAGLCSPRGPGPGGHHPWKTLPPGKSGRQNRKPRRYPSPTWSSP